jgi:hypothetical protein
MKESLFPLQRQRDCEPGPLQIPWSVAEKAYSAYVAQYGRGQSLMRLAERGGFGWGEMDTLYPNWRKETDSVLLLQKQRDILLEAVQFAAGSLCQVANYEISPIVIQDVYEHLEVARKQVE